MHATTRMGPRLVGEFESPGSFLRVRVYYASPQVSETRTPDGENSRDGALGTGRDSGAGRR